MKLIKWLLGSIDDGPDIYKNRFPPKIYGHIRVTSQNEYHVSKELRFTDQEINGLQDDSKTIVGVYKLVGTYVIEKKTNIVKSLIIPGGER